MPDRRNLPETQWDGDGEPVPRHGVLAWWQRRSWRKDLAALARVRDGLRRLDLEPSDGKPECVPPIGTAAAGVPAEPSEDLTGEAAAPSSAGRYTPEAGDGALPDSAIVSIRDSFGIVAAAGEAPASYFYGRLFAGYPHLRELFPPAMDMQRDRLLRALVRIVEGLSSPEDLAAYLSQLGRDHRKYSVEPAMYDAVGESLIATLRTFAGPAFTENAETAWIQAYQAASALMIRAAEDDRALAPANWTAEVVDHELRQPGIAVVTVAPYQPMPYLAGQHVTVQTPRWPRVWRPYSVANRPREDNLMTFHVRAVSGGWVSNALVRHAAPGDELILGPPLGTMTLAAAEQRDLLCVAGGTGLSPVKALVEQAIRESSACPRQIFVFYGARTREELYDLPDLYRLADSYPHLLLTPVTSDDPAFDGMQGNVARVAARYLPHRECEAYVAGPVAMVREAIRVLARAGIPAHRIHYDDALLADGKPAESHPPPAKNDSPAQSSTTIDTDAVAETRQSTQSTRDSGPGPGPENTPPELEPVPADSDRTA
jgi:NAD(P)H-flavin reductase/hemoglobin-like flavoprotein